VWVKSFRVLNTSKNPPFTIEDNTDGGDDIRMKYRYLDLRRNPVREGLQLRHKMAQQTRLYLDSLNFIEVETPVLIKSTPKVHATSSCRHGFTTVSSMHCHNHHKLSSNC